MLSGVASALFMARRIQAGLAANSRPSSTNRMPTPMRKSTNAMDLIGLKPPPRCLFFVFWKSEVRLAPVLFALRLRRGRGTRRWRSRNGRLARRVAEELEEVRVRPQQ